MIFQSQENQDIADGVKNTVNSWGRQRKWPALFSAKLKRTQGVLGLIQFAPYVSEYLVTGVPSKKHYLSARLYFR
jgi:hypothetical protein